MAPISAYLYRFAKKKGICVREHHSIAAGQNHYFCHLQCASGNPQKTATAVSLNSPADALVMAFLSFFDPSCNFLDSD